MLFNSARFFVFLPLVLLAFYCSPRSWRKPILLAASYYFYMCWNPVFILLLLTLTAIDYTSGVWMERVESPVRRRLLLIASLCANLGFLGFFKYYNFLAENLAVLTGLPPHAFALSIILPLGISFHTFQSMSYVVDVYRREQPAIRNPLDYALFIAFFPQLVAGPIVRAREFFRDLYNWVRPTADEWSSGLLLIVLGLTKKVAFADQFAKVADGYFSNAAAHPGMVQAWTGVIAFGMQIFFDFSGYTDMAIGIARVLGFHFPENFRRPYLAASITDFWHRWHISLSRWLRDYLYISLGGNRGGRLLTYRNLILTMLLGGLWHGASWNFVIWGGYHGSLLALERALGIRDAGGWLSKALYPVRALLTFALVMIGWVFFRAATLPDSLYIVRQMLAAPHGRPLIAPWQLGLIAVALLIAIVEEKLAWFERLARGPAWAYGAACAVMLLFVELIGITDVAQPFVYFQF